jgi:uncharacterized membrane protein
MILVATSSLNALAGVGFCNRTDEAIFIATHARESNTSTSKTTRGWYRIEPSACIKTSIDVRLNEIVYVRVTGSNEVHSDWPVVGSSDQCVKDEPFGAVFPGNTCPPGYEAAHFDGYRFGILSEAEIDYSYDGSRTGRGKRVVTNERTTTIAIPRYPPGSDEALEEERLRQQKLDDARAKIRSEQEQREQQRKENAANARAHIEADARRRAEGNTANCQGLDFACGAVCFNPAKDSCQVAYDGRKVVCGKLDTWCPKQGRCLRAIDSCDGLR